VNNESRSATRQNSLEGDRGGSIVAAISRDMVRIHSHYYGRGPTRAKTIWRDEVVVSILEDIFTRAERLLVDAGHFEEVRTHRMHFQDEVRPLFCGSIEKHTGRQVRAFLSQTSSEGAASEVFVLGDPVGPDGPANDPDAVPGT
jgi:uncharacterized protein YbcI